MRLFLPFPLIKNFLPFLLLTSENLCDFLDLPMLINIAFVLCLTTTATTKKKSSTHEKSFSKSFLLSNLFYFYCIHNRKSFFLLVSKTRHTNKTMIFSIFLSIFKKALNFIINSLKKQNVLLLFLLLCAIHKKVFFCWLFFIEIVCINCYVTIKWMRTFRLIFLH